MERVFLISKTGDTFIIADKTGIAEIAQVAPSGDFHSWEDLYGWFVAHGALPTLLLEAAKRLDAGEHTQVTVANFKEETEPETQSDCEWAKKFVETLRENDRIFVYHRVDSDSGKIEETYILYRPPAVVHSIFLSGDCAAVKKAIERGLLKQTDGATYKRFV